MYYTVRPTLKGTLTQGIPQQPSTEHIARLYAFFSCYFVFKIENVKEEALTPTHPLEGKTFLLLVLVL